jgi:hypothetical protein
MGDEVLRFVSSLSRRSIHPSFIGDGSDVGVCASDLLLRAARNAQTIANPNLIYCEPIEFEMAEDRRGCVEFYGFSLARHCFDRHLPSNQNLDISHTSERFSC